MLEPHHTETPVDYEWRYKNLEVLPVRLIPEKYIKNCPPWRAGSVPGQADLPICRSSITCYGDNWNVSFVRLRLFLLKISSLEYPLLLYVCVKYLSSINLYTNRSADAAGHVTKKNMTKWTRYLHICWNHLSFIQVVYLIYCKIYCCHDFIY